MPNIAPAEAENTLSSGPSDEGPHIFEDDMGALQYGQMRRFQARNSHRETVVSESVRVVMFFVMRNRPTNLISSASGGAMHYHDSDDLKVLSEFKKLAPKEFSAFVEFDKIVGREDGAIPRKYRELIAIAVACTTQCPYCLEVHTRAAKRAGVTRQEVTEAAMVAGALRAGAAVTHAALGVKLFDQA